jgi:hypothetical protein
MGGMGADFTNPEWPRRKMFYRALMGDTVQQLAEMINYVKSSGLDRIALAYQQKDQPTASQEELSKLKNNILVICGDNDNDDGSAAQLSLLIPNGFLIKVPGTHNTVSQSKEFSDKVLQFLDQQIKPPAP